MPSDRARFTHTFNNVKGLSETEANDLVATLRNGTEAEQQAARERLILGCGPLAVSLVARHIRQFGRDQHLQDDLISVAMLHGAVKAIDRLRKNKSTHALGTLANSIRHAIGQYAQSDTGLGGLGAVSRWRRRKQGVTLPTFKDVDPKDQPEPWARTSRDADLLEEIYACCLDDLDRQIIERRLQGLSVSEIAREFRKSGMRDARAKIGLRLAAIRKRYEQRCEAQK